MHLIFNLPKTLGAILLGLQTNSLRLVELLNIHKNRCEIPHYAGPYGKIWSFYSYRCRNVCACLCESVANLKSAIESLTPAPWSALLHLQHNRWPHRDRSAYGAFWGAQQGVQGSPRLQQGSPHSLWPPPGPVSRNQRQRPVHNPGSPLKFLRLRRYFAKLPGNLLWNSALVQLWQSHESCAFSSSHFTTNSLR